jgi:hypothetical protein
MLDFEYCRKCRGTGGEYHPPEKHAKRADSHPPAAFFRAARIVIVARRKLWDIANDLSFLEFEVKHGYPPTTFKDIAGCLYGWRLREFRPRTNALMQLIPFNKTAQLGQEYTVPIVLS